MFKIAITVSNAVSVLMVLFHPRRWWIVRVFPHQVVLVDEHQSDNVAERHGVWTDLNVAPREGHPVEVQTGVQVVNLERHQHARNQPDQVLADFTKQARPMTATIADHHIGPGPLQLRVHRVEVLEAMLPSASNVTTRSVVASLTAVFSAPP